MKPIGWRRRPRLPWSSTQPFAILCLALLFHFAFFPLPSPAQGVITTVAGNGRALHGDGGPATNASLGEIGGVAVDSAGNVYASDRYNNQVVKISTTGVLTVVAGNGLQGFSGDGGPATAASLNFPRGVAVDGSGNLYITDRENNRIRKVNSSGVINTVAGNGEYGFSGDGGPATSASFRSPSGVALDATRNLFIAEVNNHRVRRVSPSGIITTVAGNGVAGFAGDGGPATTASLYQAWDVTLDGSGNLYISDTVNNRIRRVTPGGIITTVAGNGVQGFSGDGGPATSASLWSPRGLAVDTAGNLYFADIYNHRIRKVSPSGIISTVAGGSFGFSGDGGLATSASLYFAQGVALDASGKLYIADSNNGRIRSVSANGTIATLAGTGLVNFSGDGGSATASSLSHPLGVAVDAAGNLYIADSFNHRIRKVSPTGIISTVAGTGVAGFSGDGGPAVSASLNGPQRVALDAAGNVYFADSGNGRVRRISFIGVISTVAGNGRYDFSGDGGLATNASFRGPVGLALDAAGNLFIVDSGNHRIRRVSSGGIITTVAGNGVAGFSGDGGPATSTQLRDPRGVSMDTAGNLYIADFGNNRIRKVSPGGMITTVAGGGVSGDGGPATSAGLAGPTDVALDAAGNFYIAEFFVSRIRKVNASGTITGFGGGSGFSGDGGPATRAKFDSPFGVAVDAAGNVYIADTNNDRIRKVLGTPPTFTVAPGGLSFSATAGAPAGASQQLTLSSSVPGLPWEARVATGSSWLRVSPESGQMPATVSVSADATNLAAGTHQGSIEISAPAALPSLVTIAVTFAVTAAQPPSLSVEPVLSFQVVAGAPAPAAQSLRIGNAGGGTLNWTAQAATTSGNWLAISPTSGDVSASTPASIQVTANPAGLAARSYSGSITVRSSTTNQSVTVSVSLLVTAPQGVLLPSQTSLLFRAVQSGGAEPPQTIGVLNIGSGALDWTAQTTTPWLRLTPTSGRSDAGANAIPLVTVSVEPAGLADGFHVGLIEVRSAAANNSPQVVKVDLQVLPAGTHLGAVVRPTGLIFVAAQGSSSPGSQNVSVATTEADPVEFLSQPIGGDWVKRAPDSATATRNNPGRIVVQPELGSLAANVYRAGLTVFTKNDGVQHPVSLLFLVLPPGTATATALASNGDGPPVQAQSQCSPTKLALQFASVFANFNAVVGWPTIVQVNARDDCGDAAVGGSVTLSFSSGDPALTLTDLKNGQYHGTWRPSSANPLVVATARGLWRSLQGEVTATAQVGLNPNPQAANLNQGGVLLGAGFARGPVAPGSIISLFGRNLTAREHYASSLPLPLSLDGARVLIGGREAPLFYAGPGQVNAQVPFELGQDRQLQVLVETNGVPSAPEPLQTVATRPGIFTLGPPFGDQGAILLANTNRLAMPETPNVPSEPARIGGIVSIFCTGLGPTEPAVASGQPGPAAEPLARVKTLPTVTIGGQPATVSFAGLAPGFVGVYQVNAQVPAGVTPGNAVPVVLTQGGFPSNTATIAVQ